MTKVGKGVAVVAVAILVVGISSFIALEILGYILFPVGEIEIKKVVDATRHWEAIVVERNAGATVSMIYSIRIRKASSNERGVDVLSIDRVVSPEELAVSCGEDELRVVLPPEYQVFKQLYSTNVGNRDIRIIYVNEGSTIATSRHLKTP